MNSLPIERAKDADLRNSMKALRRAAARARALATATQTDLIIVKGGVIERIAPTPANVVREPRTPYEPTP